MLIVATFNYVLLCEETLKKWYQEFSIWYPQIYVFCGKKKFGYQKGTNGTLFYPYERTKGLSISRKPLKNVKIRYFLPYLANETATAHATVAPTIGLLPIPIKPIIST